MLFLFPSYGYFRGDKVNFDPKPYARRILIENEAVMKKIRVRQKEAVAEAERLGKAIMAADPSVRRVILFGSLAAGMPKNLHFDIDLAIDGGDPHRAMTITSDSSFKVDIVELESLAEHFRKLVLERGRVLPGIRLLFNNMNKIARLTGSTR